MYQFLNIYIYICIEEFRVSVLIKGFFFHMKYFSIIIYLSEKNIDENIFFSFDLKLI
jgi:hypothetical protein